MSSFCSWNCCFVLFFLILQALKFLIVDWNRITSWSDHNGFKNYYVLNINSFVTLARGNVILLPRRQINLSMDVFTLCLCLCMYLSRLQAAKTNSASKQSPWSWSAGPVPWPCGPRRWGCCWRWEAGGRCAWSSRKPRSRSPATCRRREGLNGEGLPTVRAPRIPPPQKKPQTLGGSSLWFVMKSTPLPHCLKTQKKLQSAQKGAF